MRNAVFAAFALLLSGTAGALLVGGSLAAPQMRAVGEPPRGLPFDAVRIDRADGGQVAAWFARGAADKPGILLLHGVRSDRRAMLGRARFLIDAGYSALLIDLQAHGETPGEHITFGFKESDDVKAAAAYLARRVAPRRIGVIGVSMGGAATLLGDAPVQADAVVLEAVYSSIERAIENRLAMRLGDPGRVLAPLLTWQIETRLGIAPIELAPARAIAGLQVPVMIVAGLADRHTEPDESRRLFAAAREPKRLWLIEGARHEDLHAFAGVEYEHRVLRFLRHHLEDPRP
ncbi:MAG: alpha/beta fold hydrolase [Gammaproteobacteria bacterium]|nr:alpha/beta fold hydrolase [Gammaproteobacteria bacterium]